MPISTASIVVAALMFLMAAGAFVMPRTLLVPLGLPAENADARNEVQGVYGGFGLAAAAALLGPIWLPTLGDVPALVVALFLGGMALGRIVAALRERIGRMPALFLVLEALGAAALIASAETLP